jgi:pentatricopeptide repeat protein
MEVNSFTATKTISVPLQNAIMNMYAKCDDMTTALEIFDMTQKSAFNNVAAWNIMMNVHLERNQPDIAVNLFDQMQQQGLVPDATSFMLALSGCAKTRNLQAGMQVHESIKKTFPTISSQLQGALLEMYAHCGSLMAIQLFHELLQSGASLTVDTWNSIIAAYIHNGDHNAALQLFNEMKYCGVTPNDETYSGLLTACTDMKDLEQGRKIYEYAKQSGSQSLELEMSLLNLYLSNDLQRCQQTNWEFGEPVTEDIPTAGTMPYSRRQRSTFRNVNIMA